MDPAVGELCSKVLAVAMALSSKHRLHIEVLFKYKCVCYLKPLTKAYLMCIFTPSLSLSILHW